MTFDKVISITLKNPEDSKPLAALKAISVQVAREPAGVRTIKERPPSKKGKRGIAGSLIVETLFDSQIKDIPLNVEIETIINGIPRKGIIYGLELLNEGDGFGWDKVEIGKQYVYLCEEISEEFEKFFTLSPYSWKFYSGESK